MTHRVEKITTQRARRWATIDQQLAAALANIDEALPGFPSTDTAGSSSTTTTRDVHSPVEALVIGNTTTQPDEHAEQHADTKPAPLASENALHDWQEIQTITARLDASYNDEIRLMRIVTRWSRQPVRGGAHTKKLQSATAGDWCSSCARFDVLSPRYRGDLCRNCYTFHGVERVWPSDELVKAWSEGRRVTQEMAQRARHQAKVRKKAKR